MPQQLSLPEMPDRTCPMCGEPAKIFGQYSVFGLWFVCKACHLKHPYPHEIFEPNPKAKKGREDLRIKPDSDPKRREYRILMEGLVKEAHRGCLDVRQAPDSWAADPPCWSMNYRPDCKLCHSKMHYASRYMRMGRGRSVQMALPVCGRCNAPVDYDPSLRDYPSNCPTCNAKMRVESLWNNRGIFGGDDAEAILDRLQAAFPELFTSGILPDYWFKLSIAQHT